MGDGWGHGYVSGRAAASIAVSQGAFTQLSELTGSGGMSGGRFLSYTLRCFRGCNVGPIRRRDPTGRVRGLVGHYSRIVTFVQGRRRSFLHPTYRTVNDADVEIAVDVSSVLARGGFDRCRGSGSLFVHSLTDLTKVERRTLSQTRGTINRSESVLLGGRRTVCTELSTIARERRGVFSCVTDCVSTGKGTKLFSSVGTLCGGRGGGERGV